MWLSTKVAVSKHPMLRPMISQPILLMMLLIIVCLNMRVPISLSASTVALNNATLPYIIAIANKGHNSKHYLMIETPL